MNDWNISKVQKKVANQEKQNKLFDDATARGKKSEFYSYTNSDDWMDNVWESDLNKKEINSYWDVNRDMWDDFFSENSCCPNCDCIVENTDLREDGMKCINCCESEKA